MFPDSFFGAAYFGNHYFGAATGAAPAIVRGEPGGGGSSGKREKRKKRKQALEAGVYVPATPWSETPIVLRPTEPKPRAPDPAPLPAPDPIVAAAPIAPARPAEPTPPEWRVEPVPPVVEALPPTVAPAPPDPVEVALEAGWRSGQRRDAAERETRRVTRLEHARQVEAARELKRQQQEDEREIEAVLTALAVADII